MPVLNDFGEAGYQRVVAQLDAFAAKLGVPREIIRQYWSDTGHLPQTLDELKAWGLKPDREYNQVRYDQATGRWNPLGTGPTPGKTAEERGGFPHFITNNVSDAQRFQQVDAQGNIFGGSWDPAANAAHPEWAGRAATAGFDRGPTVRTAAARPFDASNFVGPNAGGYQSMVDGQPAQFATQAEAEADYNRRTGETGGGAPPAGQPSGGGAGGGGGGGAPPSGGGYVPPAPGAPVVGGTLTNPQVDQLLVQLMNNAATLAYNYARLHEVDIPDMQNRSEAEKERLRQAAAAQAAKEVQDRAESTGTYPDGTPTLKARQLAGEQTGQVPNTGLATRAAAAFAQAKKDNPAIGGFGPEAGRIWQSLVPGLSAEQGLAMSKAANEYFAATGSGMPDDVAAKALAGITGRPSTDFQTLTPDAQRIANDAARVAIERQTAEANTAHQRNADAVAALQLLSTLRGPENAFVYAQTLANMPDSIKQTIQQMTANLPVTSNLNPAQRGVLGDVGAMPPAPLGTGPSAIGAPALVSPATPGMPAGPPGADPRGAKVGLASAGMPAPSPLLGMSGTSPTNALLAMSGATPTVNPNRGTFSDARTGGVGAGAGDLRPGAMDRPAPGATGAPTPGVPATALPPSHAGVATASSMPVMQRGLIPGAGTVPGDGTVQGGPFLTMQPGAAPAPMPMPTYTPTPGVGGLERMPQMVPGGGLIDLGTPSSEGYATVQDPATGKRYYRAPGGMILDTQTGAQVQDPTLGRDTPRVGGVGPTGLDPRGPIMSTMPVRFPSTVPTTGVPPVMHTLPVAQRPLIPGTPTTTGATPTTPGMVAPAQLSPTDMQNLNVYGKKLLFAGYENQGQDKEAAMDEYMKSLPVASGPRVGRRRAA